MDRIMLYNVLYALAARGGREEALFGASAPAARAAFARSLAGDEFPEIWFEIPLAGDPWFDLHVLTSRESLSPDTNIPESFASEARSTLAWFAMQESIVKQLALSWDTGQGPAEHPALQLLVGTSRAQVTCDFLDAAGRPDAKGSYRTFVESLPDGWFACYAGVFPARPGHNLRVECIPTRDLQHAYTNDPALLVRHLSQVGLAEPGGTLAARCQMMAQTPFRLEFQFDVEPDGRAGRTFGASLRFAKPPREGNWEGFVTSGSAGALMRKVESWGLADERWRLLEEAIFANRLSKDGESHSLYCYPAFCKLRWRDGEPLDAKAYLIAGAQ